MITVNLPYSFTKMTNHQDTIRVQAHTVSEALRELVSYFPGLKNYIYDTNNQCNEFLSIYVNGCEKDINNNQNLKVRENDVISLVTAIAGG